jgi:Transglutaminase-like superfamily
MSAYWIPNHVHVCGIDDTLIWFDVRRDKYLGVNTAEVQALGSVVQGWSDAFTSGHLPRAEAGKSALEIAELLVSKGLLTRERRAGKSAEPTSIEAPKRPLLSEDSPVRPSIRLHHVLQMISAYFMTLVALRLFSLEYALAHVQTRKARHGRTWTEQDLRVATELVAIFSRLRLYLYTANLECLFDSLSLSRFLARYGIYPIFVIGVSAKPFSAHCWLQQEDVVFNSEPTYTQGFTPILVI